MTIDVASRNDSLRYYCCASCSCSVRPGCPFYEHICVNSNIIRLSVLVLLAGTTTNLTKQHRQLVPELPSEEAVDDEVD